MAKTGIPAYEYFMLLRFIVESQSFDQAADLMLTRIDNEEHKQVLKAFVAFRAKFSRTQQSKERREHSEQKLRNYAKAGLPELAFQFYGETPACFRAKIPTEFFDQVRKVQSKMNGESLLIEVQRFASKNNRAPEDVYDLTSGLKDSKWDHVREFTMDSWGGELEIIIKGQRVQIRSLGEDRKPGTSDDFVAAEGFLYQAI